MNSIKNIPFEFILDYLPARNIRVKPMFGCFAVYVNNKLVFILRDRKNNPHLNGVWVASSNESLASLTSILPAIDLEARLVERKAKGSSWLLIPKDKNQFEETVIIACEMVSSNDSRIGKITNSSILN
jgi:hypothetical protein